MSERLRVLLDSRVSSPHGIAAEDPVWHDLLTILLDSNMGKEGVPSLFTGGTSLVGIDQGMN